MQNNRILSGLGLAQKAGCIASGEFAVEKAVKGGLAHVVIVAEDEIGYIDSFLFVKSSHSSF